MKQENKLLQYSSLAVSFIFLNEANTEVIYTDIEPDIVLDEALESAGIDMDNNGSIDFAFLNNSFTYYNSIWFSERLRQDILAGPYIQNNNIAAITVFFSTGSGGFEWTFPYAFTSDELINNYLQWHSGSEQIIAIRTYYQNGNLYNTCNQCFWYNGEVLETLDHYLGVRFIDTESLIHYGWIRCDVIDEGRTLIIKDYAYNEVPLEGLYAGKLISSAEEINSLYANVYNFNNSIFINLNEFINGVEIHIYDPNGKMIYSDEVINQITQIELNKAKGVYFVELISGEKKFRKKVYLN